MASNNHEPCIDDKIFATMHEKWKSSEKVSDVRFHKYALIGVFR
jgi:hypothetical protein